MIEAFTVCHTVRWVVALFNSLRDQQQRLVIAAPGLHVGCACESIALAGVSGKKRRASAIGPWV